MVCEAAPHSMTEALSRPILGFRPGQPSTERAAKAALPETFAFGQEDQSLIRNWEIWPATSWNAESSDFLSVALKNRSGRDAQSRTLSMARWLDSRKRIVMTVI